MIKDKRQLTPNQIRQLIDYLFDYQMTNYGYDARDYSRITAQRRRAKAQVSQLYLTNRPKFECNVQAEWLNNEYLSLVGDKVHLTTQSPNEDVTNVLRRIAEPSAKWAS